MTIGNATNTDEDDVETTRLEYDSPPNTSQWLELCHTVALPQHSTAPVRTIQQLASPDENARHSLPCRRSVCELVPSLPGWGCSVLRQRYSVTTGVGE